MAYGDWDEYLIHQIPTTIDHVGESDPHWTDRVYFNCHARDGSALLVCGYGVFPNTQQAIGYAKLALADGRHFDASMRRPLEGDRVTPFAGPMRYEVLEPRKRWRLQLGPNPSGLEYDIEYQARAPIWELKPLFIRKHGMAVVNQQHIQQSADYRGWIKADGQKISVDGFYGSRDRTWGIRKHNEVDMWVWFAAQFDDRAIAAWVWHNAAGEVLYVDGGFCHTDGRKSKRFIKMDVDVAFDGDLRRPASAQIRFVDEALESYVVRARAAHPHVGVYYGGSLKQPSSEPVRGENWSSGERDSLKRFEAGSFSSDQLMRYEFGGQVGYGVFECFSSGDGYPKWQPNWPPTQWQRLGS